MSRTKQRNRKMPRVAEDRQPRDVSQFVKRHLDAAQEKSQQEKQRDLTAEEVAEETQVAQEAYDQLTQEKKERQLLASAMSLLRSYCIFVLGDPREEEGQQQGCSRPVTTETAGQLASVSLTLAGQHLEATGSTKLEATEAMFRCACVWLC
jgi:hypothetical protein